MKISLNLVEFVGIVVGDGHIHKTQNAVTISGSTEDEFYYRYYISPLIKTIFNLNSTIYFQKNRNACYLSVNSEKVVETLLKMGFRRGKKYYKLPTELKKVKFYARILRGLFDTDGSLKFSKQTRKINYYPRIQIAISPSKFGNFISTMLNKLSFGHGKWLEDNSRGFNKNGMLLYYHVSGGTNLNKWMREIGSSNPVHITKYLFWKKYGYYKPKLKLRQRIKALNISAATVVNTAP